VGCSLINGVHHSSFVIHCVIILVMSKILPLEQMLFSASTLFLFLSVPELNINQNKAGELQSFPDEASCIFNHYLLVSMNFFYSQEH